MAAVKKVGQKNGEVGLLVEILRAPIANNSNNFAYPRPFYFLLQLTFIFAGLSTCCTARSTSQATSIVVLQIVPA